MEVSQTLSVSQKVVAAPVGTDPLIISVIVIVEVVPETTVWVV